MQGVERGVMASRAESDKLDAQASARAWVDAYCAQAAPGDVLCAAGDSAWREMLEELAGFSGGALDHARERAAQHAGDIGTGFRIAGEGEERAWPLSPIPLMLSQDEWRGIEAGVAQRADLLEKLAADIYGPRALVADGSLPAALIVGSPYFLRPMEHLVPPGGFHLNFVAFDLGRTPDGEWRVLSDQLRAPAGAGYALENRLALSRMLGGLQSRLNIQRHAPFFAAFREGLAALSARSDPRIALLTPGRYSASYPEQAHLARYLGFLLVEGADLAVVEDRVFVRTIAGLKRIDALWRRVDPRLLDPLAFDSHSAIGVPGLIDAMALGNVVVGNAPGVGVLEAPAFDAFLPGLAERLTGAPLLLRGPVTQWCGDDAARAAVERDLDGLLIAPAFGGEPLGLPDGAAVVGAELGAGERAALLDDMSRRPQDYVGQQVVRLSTMPVVADGALSPRPFTLRVFAARGRDGQWTVLPGGFARIGEHTDVRAAVMGEGTWSADVVVHGPEPVPAVSLLPADAMPLRRNPGTLPSRVADNMFWLGRYLERGEALLGMLRVLLGHSISADGGAALASDTVARLVDLVAESGAAPRPATLDRHELSQFARVALESREYHSVRAINRLARTIGESSRERLSADMVRLLEAPFPTRGGLLDRAGSLQRRYSALVGLAAEHMARTDAWRFHDLGRRLERAIALVRILRAFAGPDASSDDLSILLDLADSQISYRQRYLTVLARVPALDLIALDPGNPRSLTYQVEGVKAHLDKLPVLSDDGLAEPQQAQATELAAIATTARAAMLDAGWLAEIDNRLARLSDAIARRYFLHGAEPLREVGLTLA